MTCEILTIGDELLIGQVVNTNQAFIAERLSRIGISVRRMSTTADNVGDIVAALRSAMDSADLVILTGGLGPTHDDVTRTAVCTMFGSDLVSDPSVRERIERLLEHRGLRWTAAAEAQTLVPRIASVVPNPVGTAPGFQIEADGKTVLVLPGVPYEMKAMVVESVVPTLIPRVKGSVVLHRTLRTTGIPESLLAENLGPLDPLLDGASLAFLPSPTGVRLRISASGADAADAEGRVSAAERRIRERAGKWIYGTGDQELEEVLGAMLAERGLTIAVAESCTGGLIADRITDVGGSSVYFERGVVAYSNSSKTDILGVPQDLLARHGAVSREVAEAMAAGVRRIAGTSLGLSTTGIAGPAGGSADKPVGLVWVGFADGHDTLAVRFRLGEQRRRIKERAAQAALELVRRRLLGMA